MLANILPGLRHVRAPLVSGYLYLLVLWLVFGERLLPSPADDTAAARLAQLAEVLGAPITLTAVSFAAYLVGSIGTIRRWPWGISPIHWPRHYDDEFGFEWWAQGLYDLVNSIVDRVGNRVTYGEVLSEASLPRSFKEALNKAWGEERRNQLEYARQLTRRLQEFEKSQGVPPESRWDADRFEHLDVARQSDAEELQKLRIPKALLDADRYDDGSNDPWWKLSAHAEQGVDGEILRSAMVTQISEELERVAARLRVESEPIFSEYDRARSEAELRYSIALPLAASVIVAAVTWQWWAIFGLILPGILLRQAYLAERSSESMVSDALRYGIVESPTAQVLIRLADQSPFEPPPAATA